MKKNIDYYALDQLETLRWVKGDFFRKYTTARGTGSGALVQKIFLFFGKIFWTSALLEVLAIRYARHHFLYTYKRVEGFVGFDLEMLVFLANNFFEKRKLEVLRIISGRSIFRKNWGDTSYKNGAIDGCFYGGSSE